MIIWSETVSGTQSNMLSKCPPECIASIYDSAAAADEKKKTKEWVGGIWIGIYANPFVGAIYVYLSQANNKSNINKYGDSYLYSAPPSERHGPSTMNVEWESWGLSWLSLPIYKSEY